MEDKELKSGLYGRTYQESSMAKGGKVKGDKTIKKTNKKYNEQDAAFSLLDKLMESSKAAYETTEEKIRGFGKGKKLATTTASAKPELLKNRR